MYRRYRDYRQRRRRNTQRRPRSIMKRPGVQIAILIIVALVIYLLLQSSGSSGNSLPGEIGAPGTYGNYQSEAFGLDVHTVEELNEWRATGYPVES